MRVALLPTGRMEWDALPGALRRLFPGHDFYCLPTRVEVESGGAEYPAASFTSCDVTRLSGRRNNADKLIERALAEALGDRHAERPALVVILDDTELENAMQPAAVVGVVREAATRILDRELNSAHRRSRFEEALRSRVSFHLAKPMIEAWLFPDPAALRRAGVPADRAPSLDATNDPEAFQTADAVYDGDDAADCHCWHALAEKKKIDHRPLWVRAAARRKHHPQAYLSWLCRAPAERNCSTYSETGGGTEALAALDWGRLLSDARGARFVRAMVHDIADALGETFPHAGDLAPETARSNRPQRPILRNL